MISQIYSILTDIFIWTLAYNICSQIVRTFVKREDYHSFATLIVSLIHSIYLTWLTIINLISYHYSGITPENLFYVNYPPFEYPIYLILGYLIYDLGNMVVHKSYLNQKDIFFHHIYNIMILIICIIADCGKWFITLALLNEISTIFLDMGKIISTLKRNGINYLNPIKMFINMSFAITFIVFRTGLLSYIVFMIYNYYFEHSLHLYVLSVLFACHYCLNMYWTSLIVGALVKMCVKKEQ
jgi:hypothetical protein